MRAGSGKIRYPQLRADYDIIAVIANRRYARVFQYRVNKFRIGRNRLLLTRDVNPR